jgi:hypothetical protein
MTAKAAPQNRKNALHDGRNAGRERKTRQYTRALPCTGRRLYLRIQSCSVGAAAGCDLLIWILMLIFKKIKSKDRSLRQLLQGICRAQPGKSAVRLA